jgi:hypothetical protein
MRQPLDFVNSLANFARPVVIMDDLKGMKKRVLLCVH